MLSNKIFSKNTRKLGKPWRSKPLTLTVVFFRGMYGTGVMKQKPTHIKQWRFYVREVPQNNCHTYTSKTTRKKYYELISLRFINFWTVIQKVVEAIKSWRFGCYLSFHPMFSFHPTIPPTHCTNIYVHTHLEKEAQLPEHPAFCGWMFGGHPLQQVILGKLTFLMLGYVSMGHWIFISSGIPLLILL